MIAKLQNALVFSTFLDETYLLGYPVYIKKLLSPDDRALEKKILAKRYDMIANQGKDKSQFKIKKLQLFYQGEKVEVESA